MRKLFTVSFFTRALIIILFLPLLTTCSRDQDPPNPPDPPSGPCGVKDPLNDLPWLKNIKNSTTPPGMLYEGARIYSYVYNGSIVFYIPNPASSASPRNVYNCAGEVIIGPSSPEADWVNFRQKRNSESLLWSKPICGAADPVNDLPWLKNMISDNSSPQKLNGGARIYTSVFKGATVFYIWNPDQGTSAPTRNVYSCNGNLILSSSAPLEDWDEFRNKKTLEALLWSKPLCGVADPLNDLTWLNSIINNTHPERGHSLLEMAVIYSYVFRGNTVFYVWNPASATSSQKVYNCNGDIILTNTTSSQADMTAFHNEKISENLIWGKGLCPNRTPVKDLPWLRDIVDNNTPFKLLPGARIYSYLVEPNDSSYFFSFPQICIWNPGAASPELVYHCIGTMILGPSSTKQEWDHFRRTRALETLIWSKD
jgi:hypothetical protein